MFLVFYYSSPKPCPYLIACALKWVLWVGLASCSSKSLQLHQRERPPSTDVEMKTHHVLVGLSAQTTSLEWLFVGWPTVRGSACVTQLVRCGPHRLECEAEALTSEGAADESRMGGRRQDAGITARGRAVGWAGVLSAVMQCSWPEGFPVSISWVARREPVWHVHSTRAASALYAAERGEPCPREPYELAVW